MKDTSFKSLVVNDNEVNFEGEFKGALDNETSSKVVFDSEEGAEKFLEYFSEKGDLVNGWNNEIIVNTEDDNGTKNQHVLKNNYTIYKTNGRIIEFN